MVDNKMEFEPKEQEIVQLLKKLKNGGGNYPKNLLASRRQLYLNQVASIGAGIGIGAGIDKVTKASKTGTSAHVPAFSVSSLIESVLVVAIVVQAGIVAYNYRDVIADLFNPLTPTAISNPVSGPSLPGNETSEVMTETSTDTPSVTLTTTSPAPGEDGGNAPIQQNTAVTATPTPKDDNGNHLGQTPKPPKPTQEKNTPKPTRVKK